MTLATLAAELATTRGRERLHVGLEALLDRDGVRLFRRAKPVRIFLARRFLLRRALRDGRLKEQGGEKRDQEKIAHDGLSLFIPDASRQA